MLDKYKSIKDVINNEKEFEKLRRITKEQEIIEKFSEIFPDLKKIAVAKKFEKGKLFLRVENSVWRSELNFKQSVIVEKLNKSVNEEIVKSIKFL